MRPRLERFQLHLAASSLQLYVRQWALLLDGIRILLRLGCLIDDRKDQVRVDKRVYFLSGFQQGHCHLLYVLDWSSGIHESFHLGKEILDPIVRVVWHKIKLITQGIPRFYCKLGGSPGDNCSGVYTWAFFKRTYARNSLAIMHDARNSKISVRAIQPYSDVTSRLEVQLSSERLYIGSDGYGLNKRG